MVSYSASKDVWLGSQYRVCYMKQDSVVYERVIDLYCGMLVS